MKCPIGLISDGASSGDEKRCRGNKNGRDLHSVGSLGFAYAGSTVSCTKLWEDPK
jgi:hypothetical protein